MPKFTLTSQQRADLYAQLAALESAGLPRAQAIALLNLPPPTLRQISAQLNRGTDLVSAGQRHGIFSAFDAALLRAAQTTGDLAQTYQRLADHYAARARRRSAVKARLTLPAAMLTLAIFIQPAPDLILGRIDGLDYLRLTVVPLLALAGLAYLLFKLPERLREAPPGLLKTLVDEFRLGLPMFGTMHLRSNLRDFFTSLALLLEAGVPITDGVGMAVAAVDNGKIRTRLDPLPERLRRGAGFTESLRALPFPGSADALAFIGTGEASGRLPEMLRRYGAMEDAAIERFDEQVAEWLPRLVYAGMAAMLAASILGSGAFMPSATGL